MKNTCKKWKDQLLDAALGETPESELRDHLAQCAECAEEFKVLKARRERMDVLLPEIARGAEPSPELRTRIMASIEASAGKRRSRFARLHLHPYPWALAGAIVGIVIAIIVGLARNPTTTTQEAELRGAQALAQWRSPTDVLLQTPGHELLSNVPKLGESYIKIPELEKRRK